MFNLFKWWLVVFSVYQISNVSTEFWIREFFEKYSPQLLSLSLAQSAGAVKQTNCISAEG